VRAGSAGKIENEELKIEKSNQRSFLNFSFSILNYGDRPALVDEDSRWGQNAAV
jgi:hypothetical protein